ncbi:Histone acetyltransferase KAT8 [Fulvia fulva]|nr:Histone acetyltransferase KAT8 [Fulvia fulva]KAK4614836.1 Histone acetyltransferase KAT8 [Fulvia fulva]WPV20678.1 Histone acetyltransferase KAT8 [Fulvia fulva]WPV35729.1 Histone acetyltransferase KAT8 [Fulvia fulva]
MAVTNMPAGSPTGAHRTPDKRSLTPNVSNVVLGNLHIKPWYPSFYPDDLVGGRKADWLYVCQWCFKYTPEIMKYSAHCKVCPMKSSPPHGEVIYETDEYIIHTLDGAEHKLYCQNLSLFAKLFLETKSVFFDASTFLYYTLILKPSKDELKASTASPMNALNPSGTVAGFFSKEKMSWDNNNLACILIFPPYQRRGLGQILMSSSYVLGRREGRFGGPERPLSALGRKSYVRFWCGEAARCILGGGSKRTLSVKEISEETWIMPEDVVLALKEMDVLETRKTASGSIVVNKGRVREWVEKNKISLEPVVEADGFVEEDISEDDSEEMEE